MTPAIRGPLWVTVYFAGPKSLWSQSDDEGEVIYRAPMRWTSLRLARWVATRHLGNTGRCGYVIRDAAGVELEHLKAPNHAVDDL